MITDNNKLEEFYSLFSFTIERGMTIRAVAIIRVISNADGGFGGVSLSARGVPIHY
jgi:hypothetical protein